MTNDPADLSHLADIVLPPPIPWWPPAPGWWILAGALLVAAAILASAGIRHHRRNAYRRAALAELTGIGIVDRAESAAEVSAVLKRAALAAYPRAEVASLTGESWSHFLDRTGGTTDFTSGQAAGLIAAAFGAPIADGAAALVAARRWVKVHRAEMG